MPLGYQVDHFHLTYRSLLVYCAKFTLLLCLFDLNCLNTVYLWWRWKRISPSLWDIFLWFLLLLLFAEQPRSSGLWGPVTAPAKACALQRCVCQQAISYGDPRILFTGNKNCVTNNLKGKKKKNKREMRFSLPTFPTVLAQSQTVLMWHTYCRIMRKDRNYSLPSSAFWDITSTIDNQWPVSGLFFSTKQRLLFSYHSAQVASGAPQMLGSRKVAEACISGTLSSTVETTLPEQEGRLTACRIILLCLQGKGEQSVHTFRSLLSDISGLRSFSQSWFLWAQRRTLLRDPNLDGSSCCHLHLSPQMPAFQLQWASEVNCWDGACQENWPQTETTPWLKLKLHTSHAFLTGAFMEIEPQCLDSLLLHSLFMMFWTRKLGRKARKGRGPSYQQPVLL